MHIDTSLIELREVRTSDSAITHDIFYCGINLGPASALSVIVPGDEQVLVRDVEEKVSRMSAHERLAFIAKVGGA